jgi:hypothetical protein
MVVDGGSVKSGVERQTRVQMFFFFFFLKKLII